MWNWENVISLSIIIILVGGMLYAEFHKECKEFLRMCGLQKKPLSPDDLAWQQRRPMFEEVHRRAMYHSKPERWKKYTLKYRTEDKRQYDLSWNKDPEHVLYLRLILEDLVIGWKYPSLKNGKMRVLARVCEEDPWVLVFAYPEPVTCSLYQQLIDTTAGHVCELNNLVSKKELSA